MKVNNLPPPPKVRPDIKPLPKGFINLLRYYLTL